MRYSKILFSISIFIFIYLLIINIWYYNPSLFFGIKYKVKDNINIDKFVDTPALLVIDHREPSHADIMIMSDEVLKTNKKYTFLSKKCAKELNYLYYKTKYNIIEQEKNTVTKCVDSINKKENVVIFLQKKSKATGIYHLLKQTNVPIVFVKKTLLKNPYNKNLDSGIFDIAWKGFEYEIEYKKVTDYDLEKTPEEFMEYIKNILYE